MRPSTATMGTSASRSRSTSVPFRADIVCSVSSRRRSTDLRRLSYASGSSWRKASSSSSFLILLIPNRCAMGA